jgi:hypothetical protein
VLVGAGGVDTAVIVNTCAPDVPPPGAGFTTVTELVPALATLPEGTVAVRTVEETKVVARLLPFQLTVDEVIKFVPFTVRVKVEVPALVEVGLRDVVVGEGLVIVRVKLAGKDGNAPIVALASLAVSEKLNVPVVVAVPEIVVPEIEYGKVPLDTESDTVPCEEVVFTVCANGTPFCPVNGPAVVMETKL